MGKIVVKKISCIPLNSTQLREPKVLLPVSFFRGLVSTASCPQAHWCSFILERSLLSSLKYTVITSGIVPKALEVMSWNPPSRQPFHSQMFPQAGKGFQLFWKYREKILQQAAGMELKSSNFQLPSCSPTRDFSSAPLHPLASFPVGFPTNFL